MNPQVYKDDRYAANRPSIVCTVPSSTFPVSTTLAQAQLRLDSSGAGAEPLKVAADIAGACGYVEKHTGYALNLATYVQTQRYFDVKDDAVVLRRYPAQSITSVTYYDINGVQQTIDPSNYRLVGIQSKPSVLVPVHGYTWPDTDGSVGSVQITFTAGYSTLPTGDANVNICITAILELIGLYFENRQAGLVFSPDRHADQLPDGLRGSMNKARIFYDIS